MYLLFFGDWRPFFFGVRLFFPTIIADNDAAIATALQFVNWLIFFANFTIQGLHFLFNL
jgi:hypothetical protein